jgi:hypothetical protein
MAILIHICQRGNSSERKLLGISLEALAERGNIDLDREKPDII